MSARGTAADRHVPVLRDRIVELLAPALAAPGAVYVDGTLGMGGHAEAILERCPRRPRRRASTATRRRSRSPAERLAPYARPVHARPRRLRRDPRTSSPSSGCDRVDGILFDLGVSLAPARRGRPRLRLPRRRPARHADGPVDGPDRRRGAQHLRRRRPDPDPARLRRGAVRPQDRRGRRPATATTEPFTTSGRLVELLRVGHPGRLAAQRRPPGQAHLPGPAHRGQRRARGLGAAPRRGHRRPRRRRPDRRPVLPLARGPDHQARLRRRGAGRARRRGLPVELPEHAAYLRLLTRGAEEPSAAEVAANPRAASARLRAAERVRRTNATRGRRG